MREDIKLVAIDLDGTLLTTNKEISQKNIDALNKLRNDNIKIVIATGRPAAGFSWIRKDAGLLEKGDFSITNTGTVIINNKDDKELFSNTLTIEDFKKIKKLVNDFDLQIGFYNRDFLFNNNQNICDMFQLEADILKMDIKKFDEENFKDKIERLTITGSKEDIDSFENKYKDLLNKSYTTTRSSKRVFEVSNKKASKGKALKDLCKHLGISKNQVMAIGDSENDRSMLDIAKISAAPFNALEDIKEIVDIVSSRTNDESAVADLIEQVFYN